VQLASPRLALHGRMDPTVGIEIHRPRDMGVACGRYCYSTARYRRIDFSDLGLRIMSGLVMHL
jgi:hypothetical protein